MKKINYQGNMEYWKLKKRLTKEKGYTLSADCYWSQIFVKGNRMIILERI